MPDERRLISRARAGEGAGDAGAGDAGAGDDHPRDDGIIDSGPSETRRPQWKRALVLLWMGQIISHLGDSLYLIGIVWLVLEVTGSKSMTGWLVALNFAPALLLGWVAGAFVDRHDRRSVMVAADAIRFFAVAAIPFLMVHHRLSPALLGGLLAILATGTTFFNPAMKALIPEIAPASRLTTTVAAFQFSEQLAFVAGPLIGEPATRLFGFAHLFTVDAATFLFSALCLLALPRLGRKLSHAAAHQVLPPLTIRSLREEATTAVRAVLALPVLRLLLLWTALDNLIIMGPAYLATPVLVKETLKLGPEGYMSAMFYLFLGLMVGAVGVGLLGRRVPKGRLILTGIFLDGATLIPLGFCHTLGKVELVLFVHALAIPMIIIPRTVLMQQSLPGRLHGRLFALVNVMVFGMTGVSAGLTGLLMERVAPATLFVWVGALGALTGLIGFRFPTLRSAR
jgi:DHA3 family macrolide efflux protein-like MFS transporter